MTAALDYVRIGHTLVVMKLNRTRRSLPNPIALVADLDTRGVGFRSLTEQHDSTSSGGRLIFHIMGALAEFERDLTQGRTHAGLAAARARRRVGGRKPAPAPKKLRHDPRDVRDWEEYCRRHHEGGRRVPVNQLPLITVGVCDDAIVRYGPGK